MINWGTSLREQDYEYVADLSKSCNTKQKDARSGSYEENQSLVIKKISMTYNEYKT